jgi:parallel beta-helix repeat protein
MVTALLCASLAACSSSLNPMGSQTPSDLSIVVLPGAADLEPSQTTRFFADVRDADGRPLTRAVTWEATGGSIDANGIYVAGAADGDYTVRAWSGSEWFASALIRIRKRSPTNPTPTQPTVATVTVSPSSVTLAPGQTASFTATARDAQGNPVTASLTWTATGGAITSSGAYTAGSSAGSVTVQASAGSVSGTAAVLVTPPALSGIPIRPGESIQSYVNSNPEGTAFVLKAGVHRQQSVEPKSGMTFVGEAGAVLDGEGTARFAFGHYGPGSSTVTVKGLEIRNYRTKITEGAIQGDNTTNWTVEANDIHDNGGFGIRGGKGMRVLRNHTHRNGDAGIHGYRADGMLVEGNEVNNNGDSGVQSGALATAAGMKFFKIANLTVRNNYVHHNGARGIWTDTDCIDITIEGNRVVANGGFGIWHEISYRAVIRNNYVEGNGFGSYDGPGWLGGAGIAVTNSSDVEIYGNTLVGNADGIAGMQASGYPSSGAYGAYVLANLYVHDNTVDMRQGRNGIVQNVSDSAVFSSRNNRFERNAYTLASNGSWFAWSNASVDATRWRSYGQDVAGTFQY